MKENKVNKIKTSTTYGTIVNTMFFDEFKPKIDIDVKYHDSDPIKPKRKYNKCSKRYKVTINDIKDENIRNALWKLTNPEFIENYNEHVECFQLILSCLIDYESLLEKYI